MYNAVYFQCHGICTRKRPPLMTCTDFNSNQGALLGGEIVAYCDSTTRERFGGWIFSWIMGSCLNAASLGNNDSLDDATCGVKMRRSHFENGLLWCGLHIGLWAVWGHAAVWLNGLARQPLPHDQNRDGKNDSASNTHNNKGARGARGL
jgi:hypothetical protein